MGKYAIVVGVNYVKSDAELKGCLNDANTITSILLKNGFKVSGLSDAHPNWYPPTYEIITLSLNQLVRTCRPGDHVLFYFSGHGTQVPSEDDDERDGLDEAIVTSDWRVITDDQLKAYFARLPPSVRATAIMDCCHSGTMFDGTNRVIFGDKLKDAHFRSMPTPSFTGNRVDRFIPYTDLKRHRCVNDGASRSLSSAVCAPRSFDRGKGDVCVLISAGQANEKCKDVQPENAPAYGAFTKALEIAYETNTTARYDELVLDVRRLLLRAGFSQNPCLECPPVFAHVPFLS